MGSYPGAWLSIGICRDDCVAWPGGGAETHRSTAGSNDLALDFAALYALVGVVWAVGLVSLSSRRSTPSPAVNEADSRVIGTQPPSPLPPRLSAWRSEANTPASSPAP
jgi:hypothetical protein